MRQPDLHEADPRLPQACVGALLALMLLVAAFVSIPAQAAAPDRGPPACAAQAR